MIRIFTSILLALVLALTSQSMAVARGASAATGQMVICSGAGLLSVYVDAEGQPTSAPHICPDAALNVLIDVALPDLSAPKQIVRFDPDQPAVQTATLLRPRLAPPPRAPPMML